MANERRIFEYQHALEDFQRARAKARFQDLWAFITGESNELLPYDEISSKMRISGFSSKGVQEIPVDAIVGSVNRYQDFNKNFLPLSDTSMERWAAVKSAMLEPNSPGLPPIKVYKIGDAYFVLDGNHRVSIAREMDFEKIEAYVTEIKTRVPLSAEDSPEDIILKIEYSNFLAETSFDEIIPGVELKLTFPGQYETLKEHILVHRYYMGLEQSREIPWDVAVRHWYENVYLPVVEIVREQDIFVEFPNLTETDLYIWILDHETYMEEALGWSIQHERAATDLVKMRSKRFLRVLRRIGKKFLQIILPKQLEKFSSPGGWRKQKTMPEDRLFSEILIAMSGIPDSWIALEQAILIGGLENSDVRGLVVEDQAAIDQEAKRGLNQTFHERISQAGLSGSLAFAEGQVAETICERGEFNDLIVIKLSYPPSGNVLSKMSSGMHTILQRSSRPILVVKNQVTSMQHMLLAYDGSPKGKEALFLSAYFACRFKRQLTLLIVEDDDERAQKLIEEAEGYLGELCQQTIWKKKTDDVSEMIITLSMEINVDIILMGGYGLSPIFELIFGSVVNGVLRDTQVPVLICQ